MKRQFIKPKNAEALIVGLLMALVPALIIGGALAILIPFWFAVIAAGCLFIFGIDILFFPLIKDDK